MNFLYCFDENYNTQAFVSIYSLLQNVSEKINIFIIHKNKDHLFFPPEVLNHKNLNELNTYEYKQSEFAFPNIENAHVSEASTGAPFKSPKTKGLIPKGSLTPISFLFVKTTKAYAP